MAKKTPSPSNTDYTVGVDLGGTKMLAAVYGPDGKLIARKKSSSQALGGAAAGLKKLTGVIQTALKTAGIDASQINGIGMACPGLVNPTKGILKIAPNLGWRDVPVASNLKKTFKCPVALINDVDAGTFGEALAGAGKGAHSVAGVFPGTGVGAGFVHEGKLLTGKNTSCMELGLIYVPGTDLHSPHPGLVMLEDLCGRLAISAAANTACYRGKAPLLAEAAKFDVRGIKSKSLAASVAAGEEAVIQILNNAARALGSAVATVINLFAPERIILGGGLVEDLPTIFFDKVVEEAKKIAQAPLVADVSFRVAKLGGEAVSLGAALYLRERLANKLV